MALTNFRCISACNGSNRGGIYELYKSHNSSLGAENCISNEIDDEVVIHVL